MKIERISDSFDSTTIHSSFKFSEISHKRDMEWVTNLVRELQYIQQNQGYEYPEKVLKLIGELLDKGKSKLDPVEFRTMYIKKNC